MGTRYSTPELLEWLTNTHTPHDAGLQRAYDAPHAQGLPAIQVAPAEGKLLELLMRLVGARKVVEVGTLAGYSTLRLSRGLAPGGRVWTVELDPRHAQVARANLEAAGVADRVQVCIGAAVDVLPTLDASGPFDAVFIDADKERYDAYGRWAARHLRPGGLLIGDNAYYFGRLLEPSPAAAAMRRFHEEAREAFDTVCVPTPDGLLVGIKR
jgi:predicted O-methyltransferase YrrM